MLCRKNNNLFIFFKCDLADFGNVIYDLSVIANRPEAAYCYVFGEDWQSVL